MGTYVINPEESLGVWYWASRCQDKRISQKTWDSCLYLRSIHYWKNICNSIDLTLLGVPRITNRWVLYPTYRPIPYPHLASLNNCENKGYPFFALLSCPNLTVPPSSRGKSSPNQVWPQPHSPSLLAPQQLCFTHWLFAKFSFSLPLFSSSF